MENKRNSFKKFITRQTVQVVAMVTLLAFLHPLSTLTSAVKVNLVLRRWSLSGAHLVTRQFKLLPWLHFWRVCTLCPLWPLRLSTLTTAVQVIHVLRRWSLSDAHLRHWCSVQPGGKPSAVARFFRHLFIAWLTRRAMVHAAKETFYLPRREKSI